MKIFSLLIALSLVSSASFAANTASKKAAAMSEEHAAHKKTADSQMKGSENDVAVTRNIRSKITDTDGLSMKAQNITIVTQGQNITLKGEVDKQEEIKTIMDIAQKNSGGKTIDNQLTVTK